LRFSWIASTHLRIADSFSVPLIYICELSQVNPFDYLTALLRNFDQLAREPALWMPWNYSDALAGPAPVSAA
jgi:transposase